MANSSQERGIAAERMAAAYLETQGLEIIARNLRCHLGELDLVCRDGKVLVIVEVRARSRSDYGGALASVTRQKQRRLLRTTRYYWQRCIGWRAMALRFDVVALQGCADGGSAMTWVKDAFRA
ncbi:MAG: YraN family protein [Pseudomonadota bacterium]|nr:YraN family protein [Pseudomonadota bacterium]